MDYFQLKNTIKVIKRVINRKKTRARSKSLTKKAVSYTETSSKKLVCNLDIGTTPSKNNENPYKTPNSLSKIATSDSCTQVNSIGTLKLLLCDHLSLKKPLQKDLLTEIEEFVNKTQLSAEEMILK